MQLSIFAKLKEIIGKTHDRVVVVSCQPLVLDVIKIEDLISLFTKEEYTESDGEDDVIMLVEIGMTNEEALAAARPIAIEQAIEYGSYSTRDVLENPDLAKAVGKEKIEGLVMDLLDSARRMQMEKDSSIADINKKAERLRKLVE